MKYLSTKAILVCGLLSWSCGTNPKSNTNQPLKAVNNAPKEAETQAPQFDTQALEGKRYGLPIDIGTTVEILKASTKTLEVSISYEGTGECIWTRKYTAHATELSDEQITYTIPLQEPKQCVIEITLIKGGKVLEIIRKNADCGDMLENCLSSKVDKLELK